MSTQETDNARRIWSANELTIAYHIAKWGYEGLGISEQDFVDYIIGNTTVPSLRMQVANFRFLMNLEGFKLANGSNLMEHIVDDLSNMTGVQVRRIIKDYMESVDESIEIAKKKQINKDAYAKRDKLNEQSRINFNNQLDVMRRMGRRLTLKTK